MKRAFKHIIQTKDITQVKELNFENSFEKHLISIHHILKKENQTKKANFLKDYQLILLQHNIPILSINTVQYLYNSWRHNKGICRELVAFAKQLRVKVKSRLFWELVIQKCFRLSSVRNEISILLKLVSQLFKTNILNKENIAEFQFLLKKVLTIRLNKNQLELRNSAVEKNFQPLFQIIKAILSADYLSKTERRLMILRLDICKFSLIDLNVRTGESYNTFLICLINHINIDFCFKYGQSQFKKLFDAYLVNPDIFESLETNLEKLKTNNIEDYFFGNYMVSPIMIRDFFKLNKQEKHWLYYDLKGKGLTNLKSSPINLTRKAAHLFKNLSAKLDLTIKESFVYASLKCLGASHEFTYTVVNSIRNFKESEFWVKTMAAFYNKGLEVNDIPNAMDYIYYIEFLEKRKVKWKAKSVKNLKSETEKWHTKVVSGLIYKGPNFHYWKTEIPKFEINWDNEGFVIKELISRHELVEEGKSLHHCVASYHRDVRDGLCNIFSLRLLEDQIEKPLITICLRGKLMVEARGACNREPTFQEKEVISIWVNENKLKNRSNYVVDYPL